MKRLSVVSEQDLAMMQHAINLAKSALYATKPNPNVGCVLLQDNQVVGEGFHPKAGEPHAEVWALKQAGNKAKDATAYVTLEPCAHFGRTPPCAQALIDAGVKRVVIACLDPNPLVAGRGVSMLQQAGIQTLVGVCESDAKLLNQGFLFAMSGSRPFVRLKIASSLDGRTAMASGESKWITADAARADVMHWRAISGAIITGINTVLADDPQLNVRATASIDLSDVVQPYRVILDRQGRLPLTAKILQQAEKLIIVGPYRKQLDDLGVTQWPTQSLSCLLAKLKAMQVYDVLVESGATLATAFLEQNLVDQLILYMAPVLLGQHARAMDQLDIEKLSHKYQFKIEHHQLFGDDLRLILSNINQATEEV